MALQKYSGRLAADGNGGLFECLDDNTLGREVAWDPDTESYIFVDEGAPSHNDRHGTAFADIHGSTEDDPHHTAIEESDAHYAKGAPNNTRIRFDPDHIAAKVTGHTEAYVGS